MKTIINLTQHTATMEQTKVGVIDLPEKYREELKKLLTFEEVPNCREIRKRVDGIYNLIVDFCIDPLSPIAEEAKENIVNKDEDGYILDEEGFKELGLHFMIGGAPFLMGPLATELRHIGEPVYAFSKREVVEKVLYDGSVVKNTIFKHAGFVPAC